MAEKACSDGSAGVFRYRTSMRGSRSRNAVSRRKLLAAIWASVLHSQARSCSAARPRSVGQDLARGFEGGLHQVFGQRPVAAGQHAGAAEQPGRVRR